MGAKAVALHRKVTTDHRLPADGSSTGLLLGVTAKPIPHDAVATTAKGSGSQPEPMYELVWQVSGTAAPAPQLPLYDTEGNMTADGRGNTYVYDEEDRLIEADTPNA